MLIVLCVLIFYVGIYMQIDVSGEVLPLKINQTLLQKAGEIYLSGLFFADEQKEQKLSGNVSTDWMCAR